MQQDLVVVAAGTEAGKTDTRIVFLLNRLQVLSGLQMWSEWAVVAEERGNDCWQLEKQKRSRSETTTFWIFECDFCDYCDWWYERIVPVCIILTTECLQYRTSPDYWMVNFRNKIFYNEMKNYRFNKGWLTPSFQQGTTYTYNNSIRIPKYSRDNTTIQFTSPFPW